ncbi:hypothetical protein [Candidatus Accumulibacter phosphatis]|jgi:nuclear transport factor 2 (NTF2) superfamily protein|uniref:hypothetical protein n=1 Tax=Candidatus Accumulibacter phosphatis TaxID=327160 RepID=UPI0020BE2F55|nr:hypothetical protein [Candidatus Accumulibacter phosphatis]
MTANRSYTTIARQYAKAVVTGRVLTGKWVREACQRQLDDLARFTGRDSPYRFNPTLTDKLGRSFRPADNTCAPSSSACRTSRGHWQDSRSGWSPGRCSS